MTEPTITRHVETICPVCKHKLSASGRFEDNEPPKAGDLSVCYYCATILTYEDALHLRLMTQSELETLRPDELKELRQYQADVLRFNAHGSPF